MKEIILIIASVLITACFNKYIEPKLPSKEKASVFFKRILMKLVYIGLPAGLLGCTIGYYEGLDLEITKGYIILISFSIGWLFYGLSILDNRSLNNKIQELTESIEDLKNNKKDKKKN